MGTALLTARHHLIAQFRLCLGTKSNTVPKSTRLQLAPSAGGLRSQS